MRLGVAVTFFRVKLCRAINDDSMAPDKTFCDIHSSPFRINYTVTVSQINNARSRARYTFGVLVRLGLLKSREKTDV